MGDATSTYHQLIGRYMSHMQTPPCNYIPKKGIRHVRHADLRTNVSMTKDGISTTFYAYL
jgi:hypothetical protein